MNVRQSEIASYTLGEHRFPGGSPPSREVAGLLRTNDLRSDCRMRRGVRQIHFTRSRIRILRDLHLTLFFFHIIFWNLVVRRNGIPP